MKTPPLSSSNSPQVPALENIPGLPAGMSLDDLLDPAKLAQATDAFVQTNKPSEDKLHAETQKALSPQRFSFFKNAKSAFDKGFLTTSENKDKNIQHLTNAAEGDDKFAKQTVQKMKVHEELSSRLQTNREKLDLKAHERSNHVAKLLKYKP